MSGALACVLLSAILLIIPFSGHAQTIFVNELHYDNVGQDTLEGIEIAAPAGTDLACYRVVWYNGANGLEYGEQILSGIVPDLCNGYGVLWLGFVNNQNGNDGLALVYSPSMPSCSAPSGPDSVIQLISYEGPFTAADGPATGTLAVDIGVSEPINNPVGNNLQLAGSGTVYTDFTWQAPAPETPGQINAGQVFNGVSCTPGTVSQDTLTFSEYPSGCHQPDSAFTVTVCVTDYSGFPDPTFSGSITLSKTFGPGSLSGTLTQVAVNGCATFPGLSLSQAGRYRLTATSGALSGTSPQVFISNNCDTCPWMTGAMIDACQGSEGNNEILFFNSGNFSIPVTSSSINIHYGASSPPATSYTSNLIGNADYVDSLNTLAGCSPPIFLNAADTSPIPPGADFMIMRFDPTRIYDFGNWCGRSPIYVVFTFDPNWNTTGNFKNCVDCATSGTTPRFFEVDFTNLFGGDTCKFTYSYIPCTDLPCLGNGDGLNFGYGGGPPTANWNQCEPIDVLDINYSLGLNGMYAASGNKLYWTIGKGAEVSRFEIERSAKPEGGFAVIGTLAGKMADNFEYVDQQSAATSQTWFYRLKAYDMDGAESLSRIVSLSPFYTPQEENLDIATSPGELVFSGQGSELWVKLYSPEGKLLYDGPKSTGQNWVSHRVDRSLLPHGLLLYQAQLNGNSHFGKIYLK
ncbi:MAG: hypothetical protein H6581_00525 [Bacteroidia bacterium]|nr:hypothetical protein [Bacteroidia bacterium]